MSLHTAYDNGIVGEQGGEYLPQRQAAHTCQFCKQRGLVWREHEGGYRLFLGDELHTCAAFYEHKKQTDVTCSRCGRGGFMWKQSEAGRWYVAMPATGRLHICGTTERKHT